MMRKRRDFFSGIYRKTKAIIGRIYRARGSAHEIALGAAIGAYWGVFPTFGLSTVLTLMMYKFIRFNVLVALSAAFISNPLTSPFLLMSSYKLGAFLVGSEIQFDLQAWKQELPKVGYALLMGSFVLSSLTAIIIYYITRLAVGYRRKSPPLNLR